MSNDQFAQQCLQRSRLLAQQLQGLVPVQQQRVMQRVMPQVMQLQKQQVKRLVMQQELLQPLLGLRCRLQPIANWQRCHVHYRLRRCRYRRNQLGSYMLAMDRQGADHLPHSRLLQQ